MFDLSNLNITKVAFGISNMNITNDTITVFYPKGSYSPSKGIVGGVGFYASVGLHERLTFNYSVYFDDTFDPNLGGKLPGLFISNGSTHGASGGKHDLYTASCRIAWRKNFEAEAYVYTPKKKGELRRGGGDKLYGESFWRGDFFFINKCGTISV